ncbi:LOW QUALITY PROTEIN: hypothetical protein RTBOTA2_006077 [Rhodotorula toruloides]|nr:LOW QUALITY PROTEIN: hypothetical protein RTBOTA2_006077 [Rhodotorula toruloides]
MAYQWRDKRFWLWHLVSRSDGRYIVVKLTLPGINSQHALFTLFSLASCAVLVGYNNNFRGVALLQRFQAHAYFWRSLVWIPLVVHTRQSSPRKRRRRRTSSRQNSPSACTLRASSSSSPSFSSTSYTTFAWTNTWDAGMVLLTTLTSLGQARPNDPAQAPEAAIAAQFNKVTDQLQFFIHMLQAVHALYVFTMLVIIGVNLGGLGLLFTLRRQIKFNSHCLLSQIRRAGGCGRRRAGPRLFKPGQSSSSSSSADESGWEEDEEERATRLEREVARLGRLDSSTPAGPDRLVLGGTLLPKSLSSLKQAHRAALLVEWTRRWMLASSPGAALRAVDSRPPGPPFVRTLHSLDRVHSTILAILWLDFNDLGSSKARMGLGTGLCECGEVVETRQHYLFDCLLYTEERQQLRREIGASNLKMDKIFSPRFFRPLLRFILAPYRFPQFARRLALVGGPKSTWVFPGLNDSKLGIYPILSYPILSQIRTSSHQAHASSTAGAGSSIGTPLASPALILPSSALLSQLTSSPLSVHGRRPDTSKSNASPARLLRWSDKRRNHISVGKLKEVAENTTQAGAANRQQAKQLLVLKKVEWDLIVFLAAIVVMSTVFLALALWLAILPSSVYSSWRTMEVSFYLIPWMYLTGVDCSLTFLTLSSTRHLLSSSSRFASVIGIHGRQVNSRRVSVSGLTSDELESESFGRPAGAVGTMSRVEEEGEERGHVAVEMDARKRDETPSGTTTASV